MARCPQCKRHVWTLRVRLRRPCPDCEAAAKQEVRQRLENVKEQWGLFRKTRDDAKAVAHLEDALRHAKVLRFYHQNGHRHFVPSPPPVIDLLERTKRRVVLGPFAQKGSDGGSSGFLEALQGGPLDRSERPIPGAPSVILAGAPEGWTALERTAYPVCDPGAAAECMPAAWSLQALPSDEEPSGDEPGVWLGQPPEGTQADPFDLCSGPQRADRRLSARLAPSGLLAHVVEREEFAEVTDVSRSGISLATSFQEEAGTTLNLVIGNNGTTMEAIGVVRWVRPACASDDEGRASIGLQFLHVHQYASPELVQ